MAIQLSDQEIARRENLQKIKDLGFNPFPAEKFDVNFHSQQMTTEIFQTNLPKILEELNGVGAKGGVELMEALFANRSKASALIANEEIASKFKLAEQATFDANVKREAMSLEDFVAAARKEAMGEFNPDTFGMVSIGGRFMGQRGPFAKLQDSQGRIQLYIGKKDLGSNEEEQDRYKKLVKLLDIGDFIGVKGELFATGTGEVSIKVKELTFLSKSLKPLPIVKIDKDGNKYDEFTDPELRYRQRYVDLVVNPSVKNTFITRSKIVSTMRRFFDDQGWLEVETPVLQPIHGGAAAAPFATHHNTLDMPLFMRIANELYLKRLIVGGFDGVYEIGKMFRNEGMDRTHNPEFTSMEIYVAYKDYIWMMDIANCLWQIVSKNTLV